MNLPSLRRRHGSRDASALSLNEYVDLLQQFSYGGVTYTLPGAQQEEITGGQYTSVVRQAYKQNGVVFACMLVRMLLFSEARFQFRQRANGRPGNLFGTPDLGLLEHPWPGATTGDLLSRGIQYADLAGNAFFARRLGGVRPLRPDWTSIIIGSRDDPEVAAWDVDADVIGYAYKPGGPGSRRDTEFFLAEEVAHFAPIPDPEAQFRGMSWLTPIVREVMADKAATDHKLAFFENGATPNLVVKLDVSDLQKFQTWVDKFKEQHEGRENAYQTIFLGAGADLTVVGKDLQQLEFKVTQGAGETRIAAAAGVPPVIVGLSEGLAAATYSNYELAMRRFADLTMRPLWRNMAGSLGHIVKVPDGAELWYDDRDIPALQEDLKKAGERQQAQAVSMKTLIDAGFDPVSVIDAVVSGDFARLTHSGLVSVQLQTPGTRPPATNGTQPSRAAEVVAASLSQED